MLEMMVLAAALAGQGVDSGTGWKKPALIYGGAALADLGSTEFALKQVGTYETHPLYQGRGARVAIRLGAAAGMVKLDQWAQRRDRRIAWGMRCGWGLVNGWVVMHNLRQGKGAR